MIDSLRHILILRVLCLAAAITCAASAQAIASGAQSSASAISLRGLAMEANSPPGTCGCFWLVGGGADASIPISARFSAVLDLAGETTSHVAGTSRGLSTITLLAGPRYTWPMRRFELHLQALAGAARGFDADFRRGANAADTQTAFGLSAGGALDVPLHSGLSLRLVEAEFVQTSLSNGTDNRQRNVRLGAGVVWKPSFAGLRR